MDVAVIQTPEPAGQSRAGVPLRRRSPVPVMVMAVVTAVCACLVALALAGGGPQPVPLGLADPGPIVGWGLRLARLFALLGAVATVGSLMVAAVLASAGDPQLRQRALRRTARAAWSWAAAASAVVVLTVCDSAGVTLSALDRDVLLAWSTNGQVLAALVAAVAAGLVAVAAARISSVRAARLLLAVALVSALPVPLAGHGDTDGTTGSLVVHVVAALVWTGGLTGLVLLHDDDTALPAAASRFSILALGAYAALAGSGLLAVSSVVSLWGEGAADVWASGYVAVVAAKVAVLAALGVVGHQHRRRTLPLLAAGDPHAFRRLAAVELVVMATGIGLAAALARTPLPVASGGTATHGDAAGLEAPSLTSLATTWRPDALILVILGIALATYFGGARRLRAAGIDWPRRRTVSFVAGVAVALVFLCSGVAVYASALLSVHLAQVLVALLVVPLLLLLGRPVTLARVAGGATFPAGLARHLGSPATGAVATCVFLTVLHRTSLVEHSLGSSWWHLVVIATAIGCGLALLWPALGGDDVPSPRSTSERVGWLVAVAVGLAVLGAQLRVDDRLLAADWFLELRLGWADPNADQQWAGVVLLTAAGALALAALGFGRQAVADQEPETAPLERPHA